MSLQNPLNMIEQLKSSISESKKRLAQTSLIRRFIWYYFPQKRNNNIKRVIQFKFTTVNNLELLFEKETLIKEKINPYKEYLIKDNEKYSGKVQPKEETRKENGNLIFVTKIDGYWKITRKRIAELKIIMELNGWTFISEIKK